MAEYLHALRQCWELLLGSMMDLRGLHVLWSDVVNTLRCHYMGKVFRASHLLVSSTLNINTYSLCDSL